MTGLGSRVEDDLPPSHPDGRPWRKACAACAYRAGNPQGLSDDDFSELAILGDLRGDVFVCAHRDEGGYVRTCACWAAIEAGRRRGGTSDGRRRDGEG